MRVTKMLLSATVALVLTGGVGLASWADNFSPTPKPPYPVILQARLAPVFAAGANGWAKYAGSTEGGAYSFAAELLVRNEDFKLLGIDPGNGFEDETVLLTVGKKAIGLTLTFDHEVKYGIVFTAAEKGVSKEQLQKGDSALVTVNGNEAAGGKF